MTIRQLLPSPREVTVESAYADLELAARAEGLTRPYVVANMITTVDGRAALGGRTKEMSSKADRELFHALREQVDAVMAGTGTIGIERYGRLVRDDARRARRVARGLAEVPLGVTASRTLELPAAPLLQDPQSRIVVLASRDGEIPPSGAEVIVEPVPGPDERTIDFVAGLELLRSRYGVRTLLLEGGPTLLAAMLDAGVVDELFIVFAPLIAGGPEPSLIEGAELVPPRELRLESLLEDEGFLFARYTIGR